MVHVVKFGGGHMILWNCIKSNDRRKFIKVDGNLNSKNYISLIQSILPDYEERKEIFSMMVLLAIYDVQQNEGVQRCNLRTLGLLPE